MFFEQYRISKWMLSFNLNFECLSIHAFNRFNDNVNVKSVNKQAVSIYIYYYPQAPEPGRQGKPLERKKRNFSLYKGCPDKLLCSLNYAHLSENLIFIYALLAYRQLLPYFYYGSKDFWLASKLFFFGPSHTPLRKKSKILIKNFRLYVTIHEKTGLVHTW